MEEYEALNNSLQTLQESLSDLSESFRELEDTIDGVLSNVQENIDGVDWFSWINIGAAVISTLITAFGAITSFSKLNLKKLFKNLNELIIHEEDNFRASTHAIGRAIADGIVAGMKGEADYLETESSILLVKKPIEIVRKGWKCNSPSKVMQEIGKYISEGLGEGISDGAKFATDAMGDMSDEVVDSSKSLSKVGKNAKSCVNSLDDVGDASDKLSKKKLSFGGGLAVIAGTSNGGMPLFDWKF